MFILDYTMRLLLLGVLVYATIETIKEVLKDE